MARFLFSLMIVLVVFLFSTEYLKMYEIIVISLTTQIWYKMIVEDGK
jgi:hypothetical protein